MLPVRKSTSTVQQFALDNESGVWPNVECADESTGAISIDNHVQRMPVDETQVTSSKISGEEDLQRVP